MLLVFYISGHGFGHASRDVELIKTVVAKRPDVRIVARTSVAPWLFTAAQVPVEVQRLETDVGVVQIDSLHLDEAETARRAAEFYGTFQQRVDHEAAWLVEMRADLVVGDIPPLAFAAAARAGIPSFAIGNFTWDWIYGDYPSFATSAPEVVPVIARAYSQATAALRLPLHGGFASMARVTIDIPLIARTSHQSRVSTRAFLGVPDDRCLVLPSFGAYGVSLPKHTLRHAGFTLLDMDQPPAGLTYQDLVAAADVVVSKPGYGIVSECVANRTALLYTSRGRFAEYDVFVREMPNLLRCRYISNDDFSAGRWDEAISALLAQPEPPTRPRVDGASVAADYLLSRVAG